jgi:hypothetical protein
MCMVVGIGFCISTLTCLARLTAAETPCRLSAELCTPSESTLELSTCCHDTSGEQV